ncbi:alkaline phosphatase D family protein [Saccharopolyspora sp. NFXS83]|uniref:alkaline phosphatase D family protein n=1 Tax=Saccharopolyspora sp. NFXS83 TaxID=2993560 RepID=UPI00224B4931|nr:alkaline phosphatase D family protein [Saccharopolyspora sp. NFXS83]MCX2733062.1 alkaline phosphatase D family protein [Saccharopolyspora sp. NFXS83]
MTNVVLGPILRYTDDTSATVWLELDEACTVEVLGNAVDTFRIGGHHYALVPIRGLLPGTSTPYDVRVDGALAWPEPGDTHPPSRIRTVPRGSKARLLFGSCRFGPTEDASRRRALGPDALESCARRLMDAPERHWPDAMLFLGDQVYADQTAPQVRRELAQRRDLSEPPGEEIADFEEYTALYRNGWGDPLVRWLLSTVPSMMIFDDHDVRDDWNTSLEWRTAMAAEPWWRERLLGGLISYWVYQHIGNLGPDDLDEDPTYLAVLAAGRAGDALPVLREFAARADTELRAPEAAPGHGSGGTHGRYKNVRWSYRRDLGSLRLVVLDTRAGRILEGGERAMLSEVDFAWLRDQLRVDADGREPPAADVSGDATPVVRGDVHEHVVVASSLPWLLPHAVHHLQSWNEAACSDRGRWPKLAERIRQAGDLEHWAAFRASFDRLAEVLRAAADRPGTASVSVLSGDVHHSYLAEAEFTPPTRSRVVQVTCSPLHNATPPHLTVPLRMAWSRLLTAVFRRLAGRAGVPPVPLRWTKSTGPYFGNMVGVLEADGEHVLLSLQRADDDGGLTTIHRSALT